MFEGKSAAFNITILQSILGTSLEPDLSGHVLMLEEVGEYLYRIDRALFHITSSPNVRSVKGIKLGRICDVAGERQAVRRRRRRDDRAIGAPRPASPYLGRADIGHDVENKVVPFGALKR